MIQLVVRVDLCTGCQTVWSLHHWNVHRRSVSAIQVNLDNPEFWAFLLREISRREGNFRSALSEVTVRASKIPGIGISCSRPGVTQGIGTGTMTGSTTCFSHTG